MTVALTAAKALNGSATADELTGGDFGYDFGETETGDASPPEMPWFLRHDGTAKITNFAFNINAYSGTYGGDYSPNGDMTKILAHGDSGYGLQIDFRWDGSPLFGSYTVVTSSVGNSFPNRILMPVSAMSRNNAGTEVDAGAPVAGEMGASGNTTLGDRAHITMRYVTPTGETQTGKRQFDTYYTFNFTS